MKFEGYGTRLPPGTTSTAFIQSYIAPNLTANCYQRPEQWDPVTVDGHPGRIAQSGCNSAFASAEAIVVVGDRIYWLGVQGSWDRELLLAYLSTVRITPGTAVDEVVKASPKP